MVINPEEDARIEKKNLNILKAHHGRTGGVWLDKIVLMGEKSIGLMYLKNLILSVHVN